MIRINLPFENYKQNNIEDINCFPGQSINIDTLEFSSSNYFPDKFLEDDRGFNKFNEELYSNQLKGLENFESYLNHLVPSTILIICHKGGTLDKRKRVYKLLLFQSRLLS